MQTTLTFMVNFCNGKAGFNQLFGIFWPFFCLAERNFMNVGIVAEKSQQTQKKEKWKLFGLFSCKKLLFYVANGEKFLSAYVSSLNIVKSNATFIV